MPRRRFRPALSTIQRLLSARLKRSVCTVFSVEVPARLALTLKGLALLTLLLVAGKAGAESGVQLKGSLQTDMAIQLADLEATPLPTDEPEVLGGGLFDSAAFTGNNLLTLNFKTTQLEQARIDASLDLGMLYGTAATRWQLYNPNGSHGIFLGSTPLFADLRKLSFSLFFPNTDVIVGRQIVNFGTGLVFSPVDVFTSVDLLELSFRRRGSDVVRLRTGFNATSGLELVASIPTGLDGQETQNSAAKLFTNLSGWDLSAVGLYRSPDRSWVAGLAFKGDLFLGVSGELALHGAPVTPEEEAPTTAARRTSLESGTDTELTVEAMLGIDYSIHNLWFLNAEYYYRDPGMGATAFYDEHNVFASLRVSPDELTSFSISALMTFPAKNHLITAQVSHSLMQGVDIIAYVRGYQIAGYETLLPDSEVGVRSTLKF